MGSHRRFLRIRAHPGKNMTCASQVRCSRIYRAKIAPESLSSHLMSS